MSVEWKHEFIDALIAEFKSIELLEDIECGWVFPILKNFQKVRTKDLVNLISVPGDPNHQPMPIPEMRSMLRPVGRVIIYGDLEVESLLSLLIFEGLSALIAGCEVQFFMGQTLDVKEIEIISAVHKALDAAGRKKDDFSVHSAATDKEFIEFVESSSPSAVVISAVNQSSGITAERIRQLPTVRVPIFDTEAKTAILFFLPGMKKETFLENLNELLVLWEKVKPMKFGQTFAILYPKSEYEEWITEWQKSVEFQHFGLNPTVSLDFADLEGNIVPGSVVFAPFQELSECIKVFRNLNGIHPLIILGSLSEIQELEDLQDEIEIKASILSLNDLPQPTDFRMSSVFSRPNCGNLEGEGEWELTLLISRFLRPVCFQEVPDQYLPSEFAQVTSG